MLILAVPVDLGALIVPVACRPSLLPNRPPRPSRSDPSARPLPPQGRGDECPRQVRPELEVSPSSFWLPSSPLVPGEAGPHRHSPWRPLFSSCGGPGAPSPEEEVAEPPPTHTNLHTSTLPPQTRRGSWGRVGPTTTPDTIAQRLWPEPLLGPSLGDRPWSACLLQHRCCLGEDRLFCIRVPELRPAAKGVHSPADSFEDHGCHCGPTFWS